MTPSPASIIASLEAEIIALTNSPTSPTSQPPTIPALLSTIHSTLSTLTLQLNTLSQAILAPTPPPLPESPPLTLITPSPSLTSPSHITDSSHNTWTIQPTPPHSTPTLTLNGHPDPFTAPTACAFYGPSPSSPTGGLTVFFQRITGQWYQWSSNHWLPSTDPSQPSSPNYGPPAFRATEAPLTDLFPFPNLPIPINFDLLTSLFTDPSPSASTFLPSPIPIVIRPRSANRPPTYQRSDNTFLIPLSSYSTPITIQFPGLRPTFIRLWDGLAPIETPPAPIRTATGTDTISIPLTRDSIIIIELSLG